MLSPKSAFLMTMLAATPLACAHATTADGKGSPDQVSVGSFGSRCANANANGRGGDAGAPPDQVLIEVAVFEVPPATSRRWPNEPPTYQQLAGVEDAKFVTSAHVLGMSGNPAEITVSETPEQPKPYERFRARASFTSAESLDLEFSYGGAEGTRRMRAEDPAVVRLRDEDGHPRFGVFVAHSIRSQEDLRRLLDCKQLPVLQRR